MALAHDSMRFQLGSAPALIGSARGDDVRRGLVADYYAAVLLGLELHHEGEEAHFFPLLIERFPEERSTVELGAKQHHDVLPASERAGAALREWSTDNASSHELVSALAALEGVLVPHLEYEEATIVPLGARLTPKDRRTVLEGQRADHLEKVSLPDLLAFLHASARGGALLLEAVGEPSYREMIAASTSVD